jgi:heme exporter protein B
MHMVAKLYWIVCKDLVSEYRARQVWPAMLMLGVLVSFLFSAQLDAIADGRSRVVGMMIWLTIYFAGVLALHRAFAMEQEEGCWDALRMYPVNATWIYLAKFTVNFLTLAALQVVVLPLFVIFANVPLLDHSLRMLAVALLGNIGLTSIGTLLAAVCPENRPGTSMLAFLTLPLAIPVLLAASEATMLSMGHEGGPLWWRWIGLLVVFAVVFITAGIVLFEILVED